MSDREILIDALKHIEIQRCLLGRNHMAHYVRPIDVLLKAKRAGLYNVQVEATQGRGAYRRFVKGGEFGPRYEAACLALEGARRGMNMTLDRAYARKESKFLVMTAAERAADIILNKERWS